MKKSYFALLVLLVFLFVFSGQVVGAPSYVISITDNNLVKIQSPVNVNGMRIMVEKGTEKYYYSINNTTEVLPLQLGKGVYSIKILQNTSGNKYKVVEKKEFNVTTENSKEIYLASTQPVYWEGKTEVIELAKILTKDSKTDRERVEKIYSYIVKNIKYDYNKIKGLKNDYVPDIEKTLTDKSGICYDYSSLYAGMLRSLGIPTKLVKGYKNDIKEYHAWNEVLLDGKWVIIDTTYDAAFSNSNMKVNMIKDLTEYNSVRYY